jgi:hypothetical protein
MTGPPYPPPPAPLTNAIGQFIIGQSQIGDIPWFNPWNTVISQYGNSPIITGLVNNWFWALDETLNVANFFDNIWNVYTAKQYGLDVWGRIVGVSRALSIQVQSWFGFAESFSLAFGNVGTFGQSPFFSGYSLNTVYQLPDLTYRQLILAKAATNITNCSIPAINQILMTLFPHRGNAFVQEVQPGTGPFFGFAEAGPPGLGFNQNGNFYSGAGPGGMYMSYNFNFALTQIELAIVAKSGVIPKPVGVQASIVLNP